MRKHIYTIATIAALVLLLATPWKSYGDKIGALWNGTYYLDLYTPVMSGVGSGNETLITRLINENLPTTIPVSDNQTDTTEFPLLVGAATGDLGPRTRSTLTYNAVTGLLSSTLFGGALNGTVGATTPAAGAFTTLLADSVSTNRTTSPQSAKFYEGTGGGDDQLTVGVSGNLDANATLTAAGTMLTSSLDLTVSGGDIILPSATAGVRITGGNGLITFKGEGDGTDEDLTVNLNSANVATVSSSTGVTDINFSALNLVTTGTINGGIKIVTKTASAVQTLTAAETLGSMVLLGHDNATDLTLPDYQAAAASDHAVLGSSVCVYAFTAFGHTIHPSGDDKIRTTNGTLNAGGAGVTYTTASTPIGGYTCFILTDVATDVGHWTQLGTGGTWPIH